MTALSSASVLPGNRFAFDAMSPGWGRVMDSIAGVTAEAEVTPLQRNVAA